MMAFYAEAHSWKYYNHVFCFDWIYSRSNFTKVSFFKHRAGNV